MLEDMLKQPVVVIDVQNSDGFRNMHRWVYKIEGVCIVANDRTPVYCLESVESDPVGLPSTLFVAENKLKLDPLGNFFEYRHK